MAFPGAMKLYFGLLPGQNLAQFAKELQALSYAEKCEFQTLLVGQGVDCDKPMEPTKAS